MVANTGQAPSCTIVFPCQRRALKMSMTGEKDIPFFGFSKNLFDAATMEKIS